MKTVLNPHLVNKAVDIYATTPNVQHNFVADELGISYKTLLKLRKDADFWKKVWDTYLVTYEADVLDVCRAMVREALAGNTSAGRLVLEHSGKLHKNIHITISSPFEQYLESQQGKQLEPSKEIHQSHPVTGDIQDAEEINFDFTFNDEQSGVRFALNHQDLDRLREAAAAVKEHLATYANAYDIGDNLSSAAEEIRISLKPGAETLGITLASVTDQVRQAYYGEEAQRLPRDGEDVRVMVRLPESARENLDSLNSLRVRTSDGREIPVTQVANFDYAPGINRIVRRNRTRSVSVYSEVLGDGGRNQIMASMDENFWPDFEKTFPDVERGVAGGIEEEQKFMEEVGRLILIAIGAMYILLAVAFRSYAQPLLLMMALPALSLVSIYFARPATPASSY